MNDKNKTKQWEDEAKPWTWNPPVNVTTSSGDDKEKKGKEVEPTLRIKPLRFDWKKLLRR